MHHVDGSRRGKFEPLIMQLFGQCLVDISKTTLYSTVPPSDQLLQVVYHKMGYVDPWGEAEAFVFMFLSFINRIA